MPSEAADHEAPGQARIADHYANASQDALAREKEHADDEDSRSTPLPPESPTPPKEKEREKRATSKGPKPFDQAEREEMEALLRELRGHLGMLLRLLHFDWVVLICFAVLYPTRFLEGEDVANNFLFPSDR